QEVYAVRNFYGLYRVLDVPGTQVREFLSGTTLHGEQDFAKGREDEPMRYYSRIAPSGQLFSIYNPPLVGLIGLGAGSLTPYARKDALWVYFELDPDVADIAQNYFSFLSRAKGDVRLVVGDARKSLEKVPTGFFDLLVVDAFSGGSIPMHLLTMEALSLYRDRLAENGVVLLHLSNNFFSLRGPVENAAAGAGFMTAYDRSKFDEEYPSQWLVATRNKKLLNALYDIGWQKPLAKTAAPPWTDSRKNLLSAISRTLY
ncbi:MAG TPA: fused MFS/spermidine synthase, partial [Elusimicrobiales bacterium]|nr:fused MFS/spermidine synthase [Elusimicrobiales bacterium]